MNLFTERPVINYVRVGGRHIKLESFRDREPVTNTALRTLGAVRAAWYTARNFFRLHWPACAVVLSLMIVTVAASAVFTRCAS